MATFVNKIPIKEKAARRLKICAIVCMCMLAVYIIGQQNAVNAVVSAIMLLIAVAFYLFKRYWWAILLVAFTLVGDQYLG